MNKKPDRTPVRGSDRDPLPFEEQLRQYQSAGVEITFANANLSLEDIVRICLIREKGEYMCDFVTDERNQITRIDVNPVINTTGDAVWDGVFADMGNR